ncbi:hypothetical protein K438DRAFT_1598864 [Mycena galopus ATCC 62051]|nr:hypothetical protein K438DRAFT_1598864 [Mycena galopus ATCC 62051]
MLQIQEKHVKQDLLVGAFHGHAHNRRCQLKYLATYVEGMGIKDLEGCECFFSKSNGLSRSVQYASVFHCKQTIRTYPAHVDTFDTYANLSTVLINNYKQAVSILNTKKTAHLEEEKVYLDGLSVDPEEETDHMEYYQQLVNLADRRCVFLKFKDVFAAGSTAKENYDRAVETVQTTEHRLSMKVGSTTEDPEWIQAAELVTMHHYRRAINTLEGLVVTRILELTKAKQSKAIWNTLNRYNTVAEVLDPPGRLLTWAEVVDYTFLSNFDILRNPDTTSSIRAWATPAAHQLLDSYNKLERAREEIQRLNIEIRHFVTHMKDKQIFLVQRESEIKAQRIQYWPFHSKVLKPPG